MAKNMDMNYRPRNTDSQTTWYHVDIGTLLRIEISFIFLKFSLENFLFDKQITLEKWNLEFSKKLQIETMVPPLELPRKYGDKFKSGPEVEFVKSFINDPNAIFAWTSASSFISLSLFSSKQ